MQTTEQVAQTLQAKTVSVGHIIKNRQLAVPHYQRPYKWQLRHVTQLLEDIQHFSDRSAYRLGSLVLHQNEDRLEIVDGQQRIITLTLLLRAFIHQVDSVLQHTMLQRAEKWSVSPHEAIKEQECTIMALLEEYRP